MQNKGARKSRPPACLPSTLVRPRPLNAPAQPEFLAAVKEVAVSLVPVFERRPELLPVFQQLCEPERQASAAAVAGQGARVAFRRRRRRGGDTLLPAQAARLPPCCAVLCCADHVPRALAG